MIGTSTLNSDCLKDVRLEVSVRGSQVTFAGSDEGGNNITVRGTVDATGTMLKVNYILNGRTPLADHGTSRGVNR